MSSNHDRELVRSILERNRYLVLSTTDGSTPWVAPIEYLLDDLDFYFLSTEDSRHARHLDEVDRVAVAVFDTEQPAYSADASTSLNGVQIAATARKLEESEYTADVRGAIEVLDPPMPPYAVFKIETEKFYLPKLEDGINVREEVDMTA